MEDSASWENSSETLREKEWSIINKTENRVNGTHSMEYAHSRLCNLNANEVRTSPLREKIKKAKESIVLVTQTWTTRPVRSGVRFNSI